MKRITAYEYDKRNREQVVQAMSACAGQIVSWAMFAQENERIVFPVGTQCVFIDVSSLFANEDRAGMSIAHLEKIIALILHNTKYRTYLIVERQYAQTLRNLVYYRIDAVRPLEELLKLPGCTNTNIVDISEHQFEQVLTHIDDNLFGNDAFKLALQRELQKFRVFNLAGYQPVFSILMCGNTGIGKTELARLMHQALSGSEPMIKINFGNYSSENALNSLIGSPRGYIGSTKGEFSEKLSTSHSTVVLIDEFEKASKQVYNFFLQLLEDGMFTDSQGRDYDLNKYVLIFTSNIQYEQIAQTLSAELRSRFNMIVHMKDLTDDEKRDYVSYRVRRLAALMQEKKQIVVPEEMLTSISDIDVAQYSDMRRLNSEIMRRMAEHVYPLMHHE